MPPDDLSAVRRLRFGPYLLDEPEQRLLRNDEPVSIQAQPLRLLALLASQPGHMVRREEIRVHLWGDTLVDYEQGINYAVRQVRQALADDASEPRWVETVPGRGYRFLGEVDEVGGESLPERRNSAPAGPPSKPERGRPESVDGRVLFALAGLIALAVALSWLWQMTPAPAPAVDGPGGPPRIVLLPFEEFPPVDGVLGGLLAEDVGLNLNRHAQPTPPQGDLSPWAGDSAVVAQSSARFQVLGRETVRLLVAMPEAQRRRTLEQLQVDFVVTGRVIHRRTAISTTSEPSLAGGGSGNDARLQVTAQVVDPATGKDLWSATYEAGEVIHGEGSPRNVFDADAVHLTDLRRVARQVARAVALEMTGEEVRVPPVRRNEIQEEAYAAYLRGRRLSDTWLFLQRAGAKPQLLQARDHFRDAAAKDAGLAGAYLEQARLGLWRPELSAKEGWRVRELLKQALALDPQDEMAWTEAAAVAFYWDGDLPTTRRLLDRALALNPGFPCAVELDAAWLTAHGDLEAAIARTHEFMALDPLSLLMTSIGMGRLYRLREWEAAEEAMAWGLELERRLMEQSDENDSGLPPPRCIRCRALQAWLALARQDWAEAREALVEQAEMLNWHAREAILRDPGLSDEEALKTYWRHQLAPVGGKEPAPSFHRAYMQLLLGQRQEALDTLERVVEEGKDLDRLYLRVDPNFDTLRDEPRFEALLDRLYGAARNPVPVAPVRSSAFEAASVDGDSSAAFATGRAR